MSNNNVYASTCRLPDGAEIIGSNGLTVAVGDKHGITSTHAAAPKANYSSNHAAGRAGGGTYGGGYYEGDEWYWGGGRNSNRSTRRGKKSSKVASTRHRKYNTPATNTSPLNWVGRQKIDWEVLEFEYGSLVQAAKSKSGTKAQKDERVRQVTAAFRAFVMVGSLMIDNDRPSKQEDGSPATYEDVWDHICVSLGARFMLANLVSFVAEHGGKKIAHHMINAMFNQSWKLSEDSFMMGMDPVERPLTSRKSGGIYSGRVERWFVDAVVENDLEKIAVEVMSGRHNHAEAAFKARIGNGEEADSALQSLLWTAYSTPTVVVSVLSQVFLIVTLGKSVTLGELVDIMDLSFMSCVAGDAEEFDIEDHSWIDVFRKSVTNSGLMDILAKIIHFVIDIGDSDVVNENLTNSDDDDTIEIPKTGPESGL